MKPMNHYRSLFPSLSHYAYFMTNSLGARPASTGPALQKMLETWDEHGADAWEQWVPMGQSVSDQIGRVIGAQAGSVALHLNVSSVTAQILSSMDFSGKRNKIVVAEMDFPTLAYLGDTWKAYGAKLHVVKSRDGIGIDLEDFRAAIDSETRLVLTCEVFFGSGFRQNIAALTEKAHQVGAQLCVDLYQSAGAMPVDVTAWKVDFAVGGSHKYFCGGTGGGYLYVRPDLLNGVNPRVTGWLSHTRAFEMKVEPMAWTQGTQKFMGGTPAIAPLYFIPCGLSIIEEIGLARIREESLTHTSRLIHRADQLGLELRSPRDSQSRGASVHVRFPGVETAQAHLKKMGFRVHYREAYQGIRIAPHFYNTLQEIDGLMDAIGSLLK